MSDPSTWTLVSVRASSRDHAETSVFARGRTLSIGPPIAFDERVPLTSAVELLLAAVAGDFLANLRAVARSKRLPLDEVESSIDGELAHPLAQLGVVGESGRPALKKIRLRAYLSTDAAPEAVDAVWHEALSRCPVLNTLAPSTELDFSYQTIL